MDSKSICQKALLEYLKSIATTFAMLTLAFAYGVNTTHANSPNPVRIIIAGDYPPWVDKNDPYGGIASYVVQRAFEIRNQPVAEIMFSPSRRSLTLTRAGYYDVSYPWGKTPRREIDFLFSDPFLPSIKWAWTLKKHPPLEQESDFKDKTYCRPLGYASFGRTLKYEQKGYLKRESPHALQNCIKMLINERVDLTVASTLEFRELVETLNISPNLFRQNTEPMAKTDLHLIVSKNNPRAAFLIQEFNAGLKQMRQSGEFERLKRYYGWERFQSVTP